MKGWLYKQPRLTEFRASLRLGQLFLPLEALMRCLAGAAMLLCFCLIACLAGVDRAGAEIVVVINKSKQRMTVVVDGIEQHVWKISTGLGGGPKTGIYRPERLERKWFSRKYGMSPMPHSIFFHEGYAIHGTIYISRLGKRASHGCVRLHPTNATTLFNLVRSHGMRDTMIVVSNSEFVVMTSPPAKSDVPEPDVPDRSDVPESTGALLAPAITVVVPEFEE